MHLLENKKKKKKGILPLKTSYSTWEMLFGGWYLSRCQVSLSALRPKALFNFTDLLEQQGEEQ